MRQRVAADIRSAIINGNLKSGDKLKEQEISKQMGISRGPVREALRDLEAMGLVVSSPYRETVVADVRKEEIVDLLLPIRLQLELYALKTNAEAFDETLFAKLDAIVANMKRYADANDLFALVEEDIHFHECVLSIGDSTTYTMQIWASIVNRLRLHFIKNTQHFAGLDRVHGDHAALVAALRTKREDRIVEAWTKHILDEDSLLCFN